MGLGAYGGATGASVRGGRGVRRCGRGHSAGARCRVRWCLCCRPRGDCRRCGCQGDRQGGQLHRRHAWDDMCLPPSVLPHGWRGRCLKEHLPTSVSCRDSCRGCRCCASYHCRCCGCRCGNCCGWATRCDRLLNRGALSLTGATRNCCCGCPSSCCCYGCPNSCYGYSTTSCCAMTNQRMSCCFCLTMTNCGCCRRHVSSTMNCGRRRASHHRGPVQGRDLR